MIRPGALVLALAAGPLLAHDGPAIPKGSAPTADLLGHVFFALCAPTERALMAPHLARAETDFGWIPSGSADVTAFQTADGAIEVSLDSSPLATTCTMRIPTAIGEDGGDLYVDVEAHLADHADPLPEATFTDGGIVWAWGSYALTFVEGEEGFTLMLEAGK